MFHNRCLVYNVSIEADTTVDKILRVLLCCKKYQFSLVLIKLKHVGVPQGSVLGPKKYCMFSKPIGQICKRHNMSYHCYADDTQEYLVIKPIRLQCIHRR
jgi:hypothetical protein